MVSIQGTGESSSGLAAHLRAPRPRGNGHETRLRLVTSAQRTPCPELTVHDLVTHQIHGMRIYTLPLQLNARISPDPDADGTAPSRVVASTDSAI